MQISIWTILTNSNLLIKFLLNLTFTLLLTHLNFSLFSPINTFFPPLYYFPVPYNNQEPLVLMCSFIFSCNNSISYLFRFFSVHGTIIGLPYTVCVRVYAFVCPCVSQIGPEQNNSVYQGESLPLFYTCFLTTLLGIMTAIQMLDTLLIPKWSGRFPMQDLGALTCLTMLPIKLKDEGNNTIIRFLISWESIQN